MHLGQGFILTNWSESMSTRIFQFVLGFVCFIQQFTPWQKTSKYINCTYGCNILGQLHYLKAQYAGSSKNVIWPGAEIVFPAALIAEIQTHLRAQLFPKKSAPPLNEPLFLKSKPSFSFWCSPGLGIVRGWRLRPGEAVLGSDSVPAFLSSAVTRGQPGPCISTSEATEMALKWGEQLMRITAFLCVQQKSA